MILNTSQVATYAGYLSNLPYTQKKIRKVLNSLMKELASEKVSIYEGDFSMYTDGICEATEMDSEDVLTIMSTFNEALWFYNSPAAKVHRVDDLKTKCPSIPHTFVSLNESEDKCSLCGMIIEKGIEI